MAEIFNFNDEDKKNIELLKKLVVVKSGNYRNFRVKRERVNYCTPVVLYAPQIYDNSTIEAYLLKNQYDIFKLSYKGSYNKINLLENKENSILFLGKVYNISFDRTLNEDYVLDEENSIIYVKHNINIDYRKKEFYTKQAQKILSQRLYFYAEKFNMPIKRLKIKDDKFVWGYCCSDGTIFLNLSLIQTPVATIDAVVCHELAHIMHPNHSKDFYNTLEKLYPSYYKDHSWLSIFIVNNLMY